MRTPSRRLTSVSTAVILTAALSIPLSAYGSTPEAPRLPDPDRTPSSVHPRDAATSSRFHFADGTGAAGTSTSRSTLAAPQAVAAPGQVTGVTTTSVRSTGADLSWAAPSDGGAPVEAYNLQLLQNGAVVDQATWPGDVRNAVLSGLDPETTYEFVVSASNSAGTGPSSPPLSFTTTHSSVERLYGADRYETAVRVSEDAFPYAGITAAFVANGRNFPDALAAAAAAGAFGGPVLLTPPKALPASAAAEIDALDPEYVFVSGGPAVVSDAVLRSLEPLATTSAERVGGSNRYETAALVSGFWSDPGTVYLASGTNYPDALAGAAAAGFASAPVLLATKDVLPADTVAALQYHRPTRIIALGGTGAISDSVLKRARLSTGVSTTTQRLSGASRYETAVEISKATFTTPRVPVVYIASGRNFADALAGAAAGGSLGGPVLLTLPTTASAEVLAEIERLDPVRVVVLGGPAVVSDQVFSQIAQVLG